MYISNPKNQRIKDVIKLEKASNRKETGLFVVEGLREINLAFIAGYYIEQLFICEEQIKETALYNLDFLNKLGEGIVAPVSSDVYAVLAYRGSTEGIVAVVKQKSHQLINLKLPENPLILIIEGVEKPGNLGAMLRTADAVGVDAVILCDMATDLYNPNVIRSGIGTVFTNQIAVDYTGNAIAFLKEKGVKTYAADLEATDNYFDKNFQAPTAFIVGEEANGISEAWRAAADEKLIIPMNGKIDSLNVSVAAAVLLYEAARQRRK
jgi:TrmH family RNA methyltransferase